MIKFWKSAAKGKTGCPVRPPESPGIISDNKIQLETILGSESEDYSSVFHKKSRLNLSLSDILKEKIAIKYFIQFMESIGQHALVTCWLELEGFRDAVVNSESTANNNHSLVSRTKSVELNTKYHANKYSEEIKSHRFSWTENCSSFASVGSTALSKNLCSTSSCSNLVEQSLTGDGNLCETKHNITDQAIRIFKKYVALEAPHQLELPDSYRKLVISNICQPEGEIKEDCFQLVQDIIFDKIEKKYYNEFQNSPFYVKAQIDVLTNGSLNLKDILHNEAVLFYFTEYLEQESSSTLLEFLMAVMHFRDNLLNGNTVSPTQAQDDAIILYDKYFSLQATSPVGFSSDVRLNVESDICRDEGPLPSCFDLPYKIVFKTLSRFLKMFLESELYYKYLSEMIHSVDQMWSLNNKSHSDCSSEYSISTQNTLLAMGDPGFHKKKRNHSVPDMTIDSNQLYNADALWQRKKYDGLSVGRINSLGRFESKFEPDPDKKDRSVLKKMVSRFVPRNTSKVEEEMAWQVAHMIVKDVTDLTMAPPDNENDDV